MTAVWMRARAELRRRWRPWIALALLLGVVAGVALAAVAGARRTSSSMDRFMAQTETHDVRVDIVDEVRDGILDEIAAFPQVLVSGRAVLIPASAQAPGGDPEPFRWDINALAPAGGALGRMLDIPHLVDGRVMSFVDPREAMASETFLAQHGLRVGDRFTIQTATFPELVELFGGRSPIPTAPEETVHITGVWRLPQDVAIAGEERGTLYLSPAFYERYVGEIAALEMLMVRLRGGSADVDAFIAEASNLAEDPEALAFATQDDLRADVGRALDVMAAGLWVFGAIVAAVAVFIVGQAFARALSVGADDLPVLRALALTRSQRALAAAIPALVAIGGGTAVAIAIAVGLSWLMPLGFVREIEPSPGLSFDAAVLGLGAAAVLFLVSGRVLAPAALLARRAAMADASRRLRPSRSGDAIARWGLSPAITTGVRFALDPGQGPSAVPVRTALGGVIAAMVAVVAVSSFGPSLDGLLKQPSAYGWSWDVLIYGGGDPELIDQQIAALDEHPLAAQAAAISVRSTALGGQGLELVGFRSVRGGIDPTVIEGRAPRTSEEIALGLEAMKVHGLELGETVELPGATCVEGARCAVSFTVVGVVVPPTIDGATLGEGATVTLEGLERIRTTDGFVDYAVRLAEGIDAESARLRFEADFGDAALPLLPIELRNLDRVRALPDLLGGLLAAVALAVTAHALATAVRRRRRELAILKTLGFSRRQIKASISWQAMSMVVAAIVVAIPAGLGLGRWLWRLTADRISVASGPVISVWTLLAITLGVLVVANIVAALPGARAARTQPALVLRKE